MVVDVFRALLRRWYVVVGGLLLTAAMVYGASTISPPQYNARGLVLLLPSEIAVGEGNPFLALAGLEQPAGILAAYFSSAPARADVEATSPDAEFTVVIDDSTRGPVIAVDVTDTTAAGAMRTLDHLLTQVPERLATLQEGVDVPQAATIGSMELAVDQRATADTSGSVRWKIASLVVGLTLTGFAAYGVDSLVERRRTRREGGGPPSPEPDGGDWDLTWDASLTETASAEALMARGTRRHGA